MVKRLGRWPDGGMDIFGPEPARESKPGAGPLLLHGHSYPSCSFGDVLEAEARQGRAVAVAIRHGGGWAVSDGNQRHLLPDKSGSLAEQERQ